MIRTPRLSRPLATAILACAGTAAFAAGARAQALVVPRPAAAPGPGGDRNPKPQDMIPADLVVNLSDFDRLEVPHDAAYETAVRELAPRIRRLVDLESSFAVRVCRLDAKEQSVLKAAADRAFESIVRRCATAKRAEGAGFSSLGAGGVPPNPRRMIEDRLVAELSPRITPERLAPYRDELAARADARRGSGAADLVARLDQCLLLDASQRQRLTADLKQHWDDAWFEPPWRPGSTGAHYPPVLPDHLIVPCLRPAQAKVWRAVVKSEAWAGMFDPSLDFDSEADPAAAAASKPTAAPEGLGMIAPSRLSRRPREESTR